MVSPTYSRMSMYLNKDDLMATIQKILSGCSLLSEGVSAVVSDIMFSCIFLAAAIILSSFVEMIIRE